jgi:tripeptide aminopeptidase
MEKSLLIKLVEIQSSSTEDKEINEFIHKYLLGIKGVSVEIDTFGNIYATKGNGENGFKSIVCHTDTVHSIEEDRIVVEVNNTLVAFAKDKTRTQNSSKIKQVGTGGDDRCGIYTCLKALKDFNDIKAVFFRFEESGCRGSRASNLSFFDDCNFILQCDRKGSSDFITHSNGLKITSDEFISDSKDILGKYNYSTAIGIATDVGALRGMGLEISTSNISCGYYDPHRNIETIDLIDLENCYNLVSELFNELGTKKYVFKKEPVVTSTYISRPKSRFTFERTSNYFKDLATSSNEVENDSSSMFSNIPNTKLYTMLKYDNILMDKCECSVCGSKDSILMNTISGSLYCVETNMCGLIIDSDAYKRCIVEDKGTSYCLDKIQGFWIKDCDAYWDEQLNTYRLIDENLVY